MFEDSLGLSFLSFSCLANSVCQRSSFLPRSSYLSVCLSAQLSNSHSSSCLSILQPIIHQSTLPLTHFIHICICLPKHPPICLLIHLTIHPIHPFIHSTIYPSTYSSFHLMILLLIHIHPPFCPLIPQAYLVIRHPSPYLPTH